MLNLDAPALPVRRFQGDDVGSANASAAVLTTVKLEAAGSTAERGGTPAMQAAEVVCSARARSAMQRIYQLRYQVYSVECGFLEADAFPDGRESDHYDADSAHFCAEDVRGDIVGYARVVPGDPATRRFPWEHHCRQVFEEVALPPPEQAAEVSRLMLRGDYRRLKRGTPGCEASPYAPRQTGSDRRSQSSQVVLALFRQMYQHSLRNGIRFWYAAMEQPLARLLARMHFGFRQIGAEADYFGPVAPYLADLRDIEGRLGQDHPALLAWLQKPAVTHG